MFDPGGLSTAGRSGRASPGRGQRAPERLVPPSRRPLKPRHLPLARSPQPCGTPPPRPPAPRFPFPLESQGCPGLGPGSRCGPAAGRCPPPRAAPVTGGTASGQPRSAHEMRGPTRPPPGRHGAPDKAAPRPPPPRSPLTRSEERRDVRRVLGRLLGPFSPAAAGRAGRGGGGGGGGAAHGCGVRRRFLRLRPAAATPAAPLPCAAAAAFTSARARLSGRQPERSGRAMRGGGGCRRPQGHEGMRGMAAPGAPTPRSHLGGGVCMQRAGAGGRTAAGAQTIAGGGGGGGGGGRHGEGQQSAQRGVGGRRKGCSQPLFFFSPLSERLR